MTTVEILQAARAKIEDPKHWTQGALARNAWGAKTYTFTENAVKWCATGAVAAITDDCPEATDFELAIVFLKRAVEQFELHWRAAYTGPIDFNDNNSHERVLQMFDLAIQLAAIA